MSWQPPTPEQVKQAVAVLTEADFPFLWTLAETGRLNRNPELWVTAYIRKLTDARFAAAAETLSPEFADFMLRQGRYPSPAQSNRAAEKAVRQIVARIKSTMTAEQKKAKRDAAAAAAAARAKAKADKAAAADPMNGKVNALANIISDVAGVVNRLGGQLDAQQAGRSPADILAGAGVTMNNDGTVKTDKAGAGGDMPVTEIIIFGIIGLIGWAVWKGKL